MVPNVAIYDYTYLGLKSSYFGLVVWLPYYLNNKNIKKLVKYI